MLRLHDPKVYMAEVIALLVRYPYLIGDRALVRARCDSPEFVPSVGRIEHILGEMLAAQERSALTWAQTWDQRAQEQLAERERLMREGPTPAERERMGARFKALLEHLSPYEAAVAVTAEQLQEKYGLTQEQWDAIPDQPQPKAMP